MSILEKNKFLLLEIIKKNFASKYKDSVLGIMWSVLKPLLVMILMTIIFSTIFSNKIENFPVYMLSGKCLYDFFTGATGVCMNSIKGNQNILTKTAAPKEIFVLGGVISEFLNFSITLVILFLVMIVTNAPFYFDKIFLSIIPIGSLVILVTGLGLILAIASVYYTDIVHLWGVVTLMVMYASAIFYPMDIIPEPYHQVMILNPVYWTIDQFRSLIMYNVIPDSMYIFNSILLSMIVLVVGIIVFKKFEKKVTMKF